MEKGILDIGRARYRFDMQEVSSLLEEAKAGAPGMQVGENLPAAEEISGARGQWDAQEVEDIFNEVMQLYRAYGRTESLDVLVRLKQRLEEVSFRFRSVPLAEEVLNINSCLPYERRVPCGRAADEPQSHQMLH